MKNLLLLLLTFTIALSIQIPPAEVFGNYIKPKNAKQTEVNSLNHILKKNDNLPSDLKSMDFRDENGNPLKSVKGPDDSLQTDAFNERILSGLAAGDMFGTCVSGAGDVNGDGFDDIIVGAPYNDVSGVDAGRIYVYFGATNFNNTPDLIISGFAGYLLGTSVAPAGDMNGDGYDDILAGAPGYSSGNGRAYLYYGGAVMNNSADKTFFNVVASENFGSSIASAGDVNGDGFQDIIIGAMLNNAGTGSAYLYFGAANMNTTNDVIFNGEAAGNNFGRCVGTGGDMNGDGFNDILVGAPGYNTNQGRAYVYYGGSSVNNIADVVMTGLFTNNFSGLSTCAGDVNADGYSDIIMGQYGSTSARGAVTVYFGANSPDASQDMLIVGENSGDNFGYCVSSGADYNSDGFQDIIISAPGHNDSTGRIYFYKGGELPDNFPDNYINGENVKDRFGSFLAFCGDPNSDGNPDILAGAPLNDQNGVSSGRAYLYLNSMLGNDKEDLFFTGSIDGGTLGRSVSDAGDVNADGYPDIIVGSPGNASCRALIYYGGNVMNNVADITIVGGTNDDFGASVSGAGDVNGDGFDDVIVGAPGYNNGTYQGRAYIYYGGVAMNTVADVIMTGGSAGDFFGASVSSAGDFNGDGFSDVVVGMPGYNANTGRMYIFFGGSPMNNVSDLNAVGVSSDFFGQSVSSAGDFNGDGYSDVLVGAYGNSSFTGRALLYLGGEFFDNSEDAVFTGSSVNDRFSFSASDAGDVNNDGYSDIIIGAYGYNSGTNQGRAYIYYGGTILNTSADVVLTGGGADEYFGLCVSKAGDVNGDGYGDVIAGSLTPLKGTAYIYFGGISMNNTHDITMNGNFPYSDFGRSVSGAGDVNGDGLDDVLVGAPVSDEVISNAGSAYLYMSSSPNLKPVITSVKDVRFDQGGFVNVNWQRCAYDVQSFNIVTDYMIERSDPPGMTGFHWNQIGTVAALNNTRYQLTASMPNDSMNGNTGVKYFRITARTSNPNQFWRSNIISGYSLDNISPEAPIGLSGYKDGTATVLSWDQNYEEDLHSYLIYRNEILIDESPVSQYIDASVSADSIYVYSVTAVDIHGNESEHSNEVTIDFNTGGEINISLIFEGFYNTALNKMNMSDTAMAYLRNSNSPYALIDSSKAVIDQSSLTGNFNFLNTSSGNYFIVIKHRNTIETWSAAPHAYNTGSPTSYSFITFLSQTYGDNSKQVDSAPLRYAVYSGDVNGDKIINLTDIISVYNASTVFQTGYVVTDLTGDNTTNLTDISIVYNNSALFVQSVLP